MCGISQKTRCRMCFPAVLCSQSPMKLKFWVFVTQRVFRQPWESMVSGRPSKTSLPATGKRVGSDFLDLRATHRVRSKVDASRLCFQTEAEDRWPRYGLRSQCVEGDVCGLFSTRKVCRLCRYRHSMAHPDYTNLCCRHRRRYEISCL